MHLARTNNGEAHHPFGLWVVCTYCLPANFLSFMENHLFERIVPPLGKINGQIGLNTNSAGGLQSHFLKFSHGTRNYMANSELKRELKKTSPKTPWSNDEQVI